MKLLFLFLVLVSLQSFAQKNPGIITGSVLEEGNKALAGASIELKALGDGAVAMQTLSDPDGAFRLQGIPFGYYRLKISYVGFQTLQLDSIHFRAERHDFNLNDLVLKRRESDSVKMEEIIIYAEKPLIQNKDGNIIFNAGESALSAGSNASELLSNVPLVTKDPNGQILVRGKEPKILIDDKPVELNLQQLQDLLESMPGSSVEKIEVMTNPPPQYANEQGGVINIVTRKGNIGKSGRVSVYSGTRGEMGSNANFHYRKQGLSVNLTAGAGFNRFESEGYSQRQNIYKDSSNWFHTEQSSLNKNRRPHFRATIQYEINKQQALNVTAWYNQNEFDNRNLTTYTNRNRFEEIYRLSERTIRSRGMSRNPHLGLSYTFKSKKAGEQLRIIHDLNYTESNNTRDFYQQFFHPDHTPNGKDSTQKQVNETASFGQNTRVNYDLPLVKDKTFLSLGGFYNRSQSDVDVLASFYSKADNTWPALDALNNDFLFVQKVVNGRASVKQVLREGFSATAGLNAERTFIHFDLYTAASEASNQYWSLLPFFTLNRNWKEVLNLSFSYRKSIRRPGINELNPTVDFSDPYNIRFGNPQLLPSLAHNFDLVLGKTGKGFYSNLGLGYNRVEDVFSLVRTLKDNGITELTWQNISGRKEYEISTWNGYTINKNWKVNVSGSYSYNTYSSFDRSVRKFRNGGSFTSNLNTNYTLNPQYNATGSFTFNRFANPQGTVRSTLSMNLALQARLLKRKLTVTLNIIDPFFQQESRRFTYGTNFNLENYSTTSTRNYRVSVGYLFHAKTRRG